MGGQSRGRRLVLRYARRGCFTIPPIIGLQFVQRTLTACEALGGMPASLDEMELFNIGLLKWDPEVHPWFPSLTDEGAEGRRKAYVRHLNY